MCLDLWVLPVAAGYCGEQDPQARAPQGWLAPETTQTRLACALPRVLRLLVLEAQPSQGLQKRRKEQLQEWGLGAVEVPGAAAARPLPPPPLSLSRAGPRSEDCC